MNLLPWRQQKQRRYQQKLVGRLLIYAAITVVLCACLKYFLRHETSVQTNRAALIQHQLNHIVLIAPQKDAALLQIIKQISDEKKHSNQTNHVMEILLSEIASDLPGNVSLKSLKLNQHTLQLMGVSNQLSAIHQYNTTLSQQLLWKNAQLSDIHNDTQNNLEMHFTIQVMHEDKK